MADNLGITPGSGALIKTDEGGSSGAHMQVVKLAYSGDGVETPIAADADGLKVNVGKSVTLTVQPLAGQVFPVSDNGGNLSVDDAGGSLTVDAPATAPVGVRLSTGSAFIDTLPVSDGAGSLTVDGAVTAAQGTPAAVANGWPAKITDGTDTVGVSTVSAAKALKTDMIQSILHQADKSSFVEGTSKAVPMAGVRNDTITADPAEDQAAALRITAKRGLHVNLRSLAGTEVATAAAPIHATLRDGSAALYSEANPLPVSPVRGLETRATKSVTLAAGETGTTIWDPTTGSKFVITDVIIALTEGGRITIFDQTNSAANIVFDGEVYGQPLHLNFQGRPWPSSTVDNILKATTDADAAGTITVHGYEVA